MKKSIFIVSITLLFCACHAQNNNKAVIDKINAIVAFDIICRQYPPDIELPEGKIKNDFKKIGESADNVDAMIKFLEDEKKLSKLLNSAKTIKEYGLSGDFKSKEEINNYYKSKIQEDFSLDLSLDLKTRIENTSKNYDFNEGPQDDDKLNKEENLEKNEGESDTSGTDDSVGENSEDDGNYESIDDLNARLDNSGSEIHKYVARILLVLSVVLFIALIVYVFLFNRIKKDRNRYKDLCEQIGRIIRTPNIDSLPDIVRDKIEKSEEYEKQSLALQNTITGLKQEISNYERKIREIEYMYRQNPATDNIQTSSSGYMHHNDGFAETIKDLTGTEMYLGLPSDNAFNNVTDAYRAGKTLYKLTYTSNDTATYEFINKPETIQIARQSRTKFLECACIIENDDVPVFDSIETIEVGKLEKNNDVWEIISKARIRLS